MLLLLLCWCGRGLRRVGQGHGGRGPLLTLLYRIWGVGGG